MMILEFALTRGQLLRVLRLEIRKITDVMITSQTLTGDEIARRTLAR